MRFFFAHAALGLKKNTEALSVLIELVEEGDIGAFPSILLLLAQSGDSKKALDLIDKLPKNIEEPERLYWRSIVWQSAGNSAKAVDLHKQAIQHRKDAVGEQFDGMTTQEKASLFSSLMFTGGDARIFTEAGLHTFEMLSTVGLQSHHKILDIGCGCLRCGLQIIEYYGKNGRRRI